jgi:Protein of unknown function (DUF1559)
MPIFPRPARSSLAVYALPLLILPLTSCSKQSSTTPAALDPSMIREAADRAQTSNNLKTLGLAMANYAGANQDMLPPPAVFDPKGKPLLSWRIELLPFMEQQVLYNEFHQNEPWDSPHNKQLISRMPKAFAWPGQDEKEGKTHYRVFVSDPAGAKIGGRLALFLWTDSKTGKPGYCPYPIGNIPDGTSNTIGIVEAEEGVIWTKPEELVYDANKPLPKLAYRWSGRTGVLMVDGSTRFIDKTMSEKTLRSAIEAADGQILGEDWDKPSK